MSQDDAPSTEAQPTSPKMGRPKIEINEKLFDQLIQLPLIKADFAHAFNCSEDTLENYVKARFECTFSALQAQKRQILKRNLFAKQLEIALKGNVAMLIFLGKNYLGQSDKLETKEVGDKTIQVVIQKEDSTL